MNTAHRDRFVLDALPGSERLPRFLFDLPELQYPRRLNAAAELIDRAIVSGWAGRRALAFPGGAWSYGELWRAANRIAGVLVEDLQVRPGARVLLRGVNGPMLVAQWLAVLKAGAIAVTTMPMLRAGELTQILDKARIGTCLCEDVLLQDLTAAAEACALRPRIVDFSFNGEDSGGELEHLMTAKADRFEAVATRAVDPALIAFSSGTTGTPKATVHLHRDVMAVADCFPRSILETGPDDVFLCSAPMAFTFGLGGELVFPLRHGAASVLSPSGSPDRFLDAVETWRPSVVMTAPTAYRAMTARAAGSDLRFVRAFVSAGEHLPASTLQAWEGASGGTIINGLGATEMLHIFLSSPAGRAPPGATGRAVPGYVAAVLDEGLEPVPPGTVGQLAVCGPTGCRYLDDARQANYVASGWNLTGDRFVVDDEGWFWFQSRADDLIVSAGYNISGPEVEDAVMGHEAVLECAVVGAADAARGRVVKAFVVLKAGFAGGPDLTGSIQDLVKRRIAPYKYPRAIEFVERLPRNASGKVQRFALRDPTPRDA